MPDMVWDRHNVFISYNRDDKTLAEQVHRGLEAAGFRCWIDDRINLGVEFWDVICRAIAGAQALLVVVTDHTEKSDWILEEIEYAQEQHRHVVPVLIGTETPPAWLWRAVDGLSRHEIAQDGPTPHEMKKKRAEGIRALAKKLRDDGVGSLTDQVDRTLLLDRLGEAALDAGDRQRLEWLATETMRHFSGTPSKDHPTVHGLRHSNGILTALNGLLPAALREDRKTVFPLAAAACLHDWGRFSRAPGGCVSASPGDPTRERSQHHCRSRGVVYELAGEAGLNPDEALLIADLCYYHNVRTNLHELSARPEAAEAAALFRLANACDLGMLRGPGSYWQLYGQPNSWTRSDRKACFPATLPACCQPDLALAQKIADVAFWVRSQMISGVRTDRDSRVITLFAAQAGPATGLVSRQVRAYLERMLLQLRPLIGDWRVESSSTKAGPSAPVFSLEDCILLGASAYTDPEAVVSSSSAVADYFIDAVLALTQAASDLCLARAKASSAALRLANGLLIQRPELQLVHWLRGELEDVRRGPLADFRARFEELKRGRQLAPLAANGPGHFERDYPLSCIARNAYAKLPPSGDLTFVVFGHSGPVKMLIQHCSLAGRNVKVLVPLMRPVGEGPTLQAVEELKELRNVKVEIVPDVALAHVLTTGEGQSAHGLMGCEVWIGREDELIASSLGCLTFAHVVKGCGKTLWVLAEGAKKLTAAARLSPYQQPGSAREVGPMPLSAYIHEAEASRYAIESEATYPRSETVPSHLVDGIVSENGFHAGKRRLFTP